MPQQSNMPGDNADSSVENLDKNQIIKELRQRLKETQTERDKIRKENDKIQRNTKELQQKNDHLIKLIKLKKEQIKRQKEKSEQFYKKINHKNEELKKMHEEIILEYTKTKEQKAIISRQEKELAHTEKLDLEPLEGNLLQDHNICTSYNKSKRNQSPESSEARNDQSHDKNTSSSSTSPETRARKRKRSDSQADDCDISRFSDSSNSPESFHSSNSSGSTEASNMLSPPLVDYCTQKCLLGLKNNLPMDTNCPNYDAHRHNTSGQGDLHPIRYDDIPALLYKQIENEQAGCELQSYKSGTVGTIMKITLYPYEYRLVGKGASIDDEMYMKREALIYDVLEEIQGEWIPVFLGYIPLANTVWLGDGNYMHWIDQIILLSYGGEPLVQGYGQETVRRINKLLLEHRVKNNDIRKHHVLWNEELGHEMVINFATSYYTGKKIDDDNDDSDDDSDDSNDSDDNDDSDNYSDDDSDDSDDFDSDSDDSDSDDSVSDDSDDDDDDSNDKISRDLES